MKKAKISLNKKRVCGEYKFDVTKVKTKHSIPTVYRSDLTNKKKELKKLLKGYRKQEELAKERAELADTPNYLKAPGTGDPKHPMTGDLSRFTSTAARKEDEK